MEKKDKKEIFEKVLVVDAGAKGKSVAKAPDGRVIFLENVVPDDVVDIQILKKRKAYYEGSAIAFHTKSTKRVTPLCEHFEYCGGCKWQNMGYNHQLFYKEKEVENNLKRLSGVQIPQIMPIIGSEKQYFYRNKMEFSFSQMRWITPQEIASGEEITQRNGLGFHIAGAWDKVLDINNCHLQEAPSNEIRNAVKQFALKNNMTFYNPREQKGLLRSMMIRIASTKEIMVVIQFFEDNQTQRTLLLDFIKNNFPQITSLQYIINGKANDSIYDQEIICYSGKDHIYEQMEGLYFKINAKSFYQTNSQQAYELYKITRDFANLQGNELVYDLYTGTGTIAQFIAKNARKVVGIEAVPEAIADAKSNAKLNKISNVDFFVGDMKSVLSDVFIAQNGMPDLVITDPPRDGMHKDVIEKLLSVSPQKIVYVSCNSATQARDLALLDRQYKVVKVQPVDMFPQTHHVENVVLLELRQQSENFVNNIL